MYISILCILYIYITVQENVGEYFYNLEDKMAFPSMT